MRKASIAVAIFVAACGGEPTGLSAVAKACHEDAELSCPRPIFKVEELASAQRYYRDVLGFEVDWEHGDPPNFGSVSRGQAILFLCEGCPSPPGAWTMVFARSVDDLYAEFRDRDAQIRMAPRDMPWGIRELHVADPDGNVIRFGTGIE